jgi:hypothetical protein
MWQFWVPFEASVSGTMVGLSGFAIVFFAF